MIENSRIVSLSLDHTFGRGRRPEVDQERAIAIEDLIEDNNVSIVGGPAGPYHLILGISENRLVFRIQDKGENDLRIVVLSLNPFRRIIRDYLEICDSYYNAIRVLNPSQIETIDMARRGIHNDGSSLLIQRLEGKIQIDHDTARRIFTLLSVLHIKT